MTRHKHTHTGLVTPSPLDRWIDATLRLFAMLVSSVAATLQMICRRGTVIGTQAMSTVLPREMHDTSKETHAVPQDSSPIALILSSTQSVRPSKDEGVLTSFSHKLQQREDAIHLAPPSLRVRRFASNARRTPGPRASRVMCATGLHQQPWIPPCAGMSGPIGPPNKNAAA